MGIDNFDQWLKLQKGFSNPLSDWNRAATEILRKTTQQNLEILGDHFSRLSNQLKRFSMVRKPEEFLSVQKESINENTAASIEVFQKLIRSSIDNFDEWTKLFGSLHEPISQSVKNASKAAERTEKERG